MASVRGWAAAAAVAVAGWCAMTGIAGAEQAAPSTAAPVLVQQTPRIGVASADAGQVPPADAAAVLCPVSS